VVPLQAFFSKPFAGIDNAFLRSRDILDSGFAETAATRQKGFERACTEIRHALLVCHWAE
jgi:hypothetical protein